MTVYYVMLQDAPNANKVDIYMGQHASKIVQILSGKIVIEAIPYVVLVLKIVCGAKQVLQTAQNAMPDSSLLMIHFVILANLVV